MLLNEAAATAAAAAAAAESRFSLEVNYNVNDRVGAPCEKLCYCVCEEL